MTWALPLAGLVLALLIGIPTWGALKFNRARAEGVKRAEARDAAHSFQRHVVEARLLHPEIVKVNRIDRHPFFVLTHMGAWGYAWCVFFGAPLTSNVASLGMQTRFTMASCFLVGSTLVLASAALGARVWRWRIAPAVHDHLTCEVLGDDISLPYRLSMAGMFATAVSMAIYAATSFKSTTGSLGGWLTGMLAAACVITIPWFYVRVRTFTRNDATLISDAMARLDPGNADQ